MDLFQNPWMLLWMILFVPGLAGLHLWSETRRRSLLALFGQPATVSRLYPSQAVSRRQNKTWLQLAGIALIFLALAAPQWGVELVTQVSQGTQVLIAVDTSLSMLTEDAPGNGVRGRSSSDAVSEGVKPDRIGKARSELIQLIEALKGNRLGILAFAGTALVQCPLTTDFEAARMFLDQLKVGVIPTPGTAIGEALDLGTQMLSRYPGHKAMVILSDGEDQVGHMLDSARKAAAAGIHVYLIGIGTPEGGPIPLRDDHGRVTAYKKDSKGETVVSRLKESGLIQLAAASAGAYYRSTLEENEAFDITRHIAGLEKSGLKSGAGNRYKNRYRLPLLLALLLLLVEWLIPETDALLPKKFTERRGKRLYYLTRGAERIFPARRRVRSTKPLLALMLLSFLSFGAAGCGSSQSNFSLWKGNKSFKNQEFSKALERYLQAAAKNPKSPKPVFNAGGAQYKMGDYDQARETFSSIVDPSKVPPALASKALYNRGNAHFKKNEFKEALEDYKRCLLLDPKDEDCRFNLVKTLDQLKQPPQSQKQKQKNQNQDSRDQQNQQDQQNQKDDPKPSKARPQSAMSREDAQRILQAVEEKEKNAAKLQKPPQNKKPSGSQGSGDDW